MPNALNTKVMRTIPFLRFKNKQINSPKSMANTISTRSTLSQKKVRARKEMKVRPLIVKKKLIIMASLTRSMAGEVPWIGASVEKTTWI